MANRRIFLENLDKGVAFSSLALSLPASVFSQIKGIEKNKIIGVIGAENSHTQHFGLMV